MATLALAAAGAAAGSALLPAGISFLGTTITGAAIGSQIGALAGGFIDQALFGPSGQHRVVEGPRLSDLRLTGSSEGAHIPRVYGRCRIAGQMVWATNYEEEIVRSRESSGGGKGLPSPSASTTETIVYRYYANFAVALCEGPITRVGRIWADGKELDLARINHRIYLGSEDQQPDSLIVVKEGAGRAPAYRGIAYIVFDRLALEPFGNRIPQLSFEIYRAVDDFENRVRSVCVIPAAGEFAYAPQPVSRVVGPGVSASENVHTAQDASDWTVSIAQLQETLPNISHASLFVAWFGTDLRAGYCQIRPGVEIADKTTAPSAWSVSGLMRNAAHVVSSVDGRPAYGGTPADASVIAAIQDLKSRGLAVTLTPIALMDIPQGNALPDPYTGQAGQPAYPWRGRVTVSPAPGVAGTPDKTAAAGAQVTSFVGSAQPSDFVTAGDGVAYVGPAEFSYRRFILHYAHLAKLAGGVDAFVIGTEMRGLTAVRSGQSTFPFVAALVQLAADVRAILGPGPVITYAADWSEYFGHQPGDGSGDVYFHLDPLWAYPDIGAIGIDVYWPLADWRSGRSHIDWQAGTRSTHDLDYLSSNIFGGEGYDWYYASSEDRESQTRTPITDSAGKPWVFRFKDIRSWWQQPHFDRPGGIEASQPTAWVPQSKPIWFTEVGCGAIDKGANQPNIFRDPKSSESGLPHFSSGARDDYMQRRYLQAFHETFDPSSPRFHPSNNPVSSVYGGPMLSTGRMSVYAWDARPYPAFPNAADVWGDAPNWSYGHWINGRIASAPVARTIAAVLDDYDFSDYEIDSVPGIIGGLVIDRAMSARDALQPVELSQFVDAFESGAKIRFVQRGAQAVSATLAPGDLVEDKPDTALYRLTRKQETDLPAVARLSYASAEGDYARAVAQAQRTAGASDRVSLGDLPLVLDAQAAAATAQTWLHEAWAARELAAFALPPSRLALEPSDIVALSVADRDWTLRITEVSDAGRRQLSALGLLPEVYEAVDARVTRNAAGPAASLSSPVAAFLDLPLIEESGNPPVGYVAAFMKPWRGGVAFYRSSDISGFSLETIASAPAIMGETLSEFRSGPSGRWDLANDLLVRIYGGQLQSAGDLQLLDGLNAAALQHANGEWEVLQFADAELVGPSTYKLSRLLRGQAGSDAVVAATTPAGARFVLLDAALRPAGSISSDIGRSLNWRIGPAVRAIDDQSFVGAQHAFSGIALRPLRPVHVRARRDTAGLHISWIRRTRMGGDSWSVAEVPLGEEIESYEVDILDPVSNAAVVRTLASTTTSATYSTADQATDWGAPQPAYLIRVHQMSAVYGRGAGTLLTV